MEPIKIGNLELQPWQVGAGAIVIVLGLVAYARSTASPAVVAPPTSSGGGLASANLGGAGGESVGTMEAMSELASQIAERDNALKGVTDSFTELKQSYNNLSNQFASYQTNTQAQLSTISQNYSTLQASMSSAPKVSENDHQTTSYSYVTPIAQAKPEERVYSGSELTFAQKNKIVELFPDWASQNANKGWQGAVVPESIYKQLN